MSTEALIAKGRGRAYRVLSRLFLKEPDSALLDLLLTGETGLLPGGSGAGFEGMVPGTADGTEAFLEVLAEEYAALFILPGGASPYESVRLKGLLCQEPEWKTREFYKKHGLTLSGEMNVFSDHVALEFDFMGCLAVRESASWDSGDRAGALVWRSVQAEFFREHLGRWVFDFIGEVERLSAHPFYMAAARLSRAMMEFEPGHLSDSVQASCQ